MKYYYVRRKEDGATLDIPDYMLEKTLKTGNFENLGEVGNPTTHEEPNDYACPLCDKTYKTVRGLKKHKSSHETTSTTANTDKEAEEA